ncbi:MAG: hypothetical protein LC746_02685, partial [Acidobacteria bacterium]|nr:hypothetical protein [Acidobacteriota bacterium]
MRRSRLVAVAVVQVFLVLTAATVARAQGVIVPGQRCPPGADCIQRALPRALPIKSIKVDAKIA